MTKPEPYPPKMESRSKHANGPAQAQLSVTFISGWVVLHTYPST